MFSCCRCTNSSKKDNKKLKDNKSDFEINDENVKIENTNKLRDNNDENNKELKIDSLLRNGCKEDNTKQKQRKNSNDTIDEGIENTEILNKSCKTNLTNVQEDYSNGDIVIGDKNESFKKNILENNFNTFKSADNQNVFDNNCLENNSNGANNTEPDIRVIYNKNDNDLPKSCMSRRSSSKSSIRKKVNINDSTEVIPSSELASIDDDEVFSDSVPPKVPRGNMCAPYLPLKQGSLQAHLEYLPDWFNEERFYVEQGGSLEPPVTPVGRDELALKRHRLYSELLWAAQAAVDHRVRFDPYGPEIAATEDCDPDLKPSITKDLEILVNRLERLVERLERSISARELEIANKTFDSVIATKRRSFDIETAELPPIPSLSDLPLTLNQRIELLEDSLNKINDSYNNSYSSKKDSPVEGEGSLENIPTVLDEYLVEDSQHSSSNLNNSNRTNLNIMSVNGYEDIIYGPLTQYIQLSNKIGGDVVQHAKFVKQAFEAQLQYITIATQNAQPSQNKQQELLKPTSDHISTIQAFREKNRTSKYFNHLSAISESIPALGWVCVSPTPGPHVKEMNDAGTFYTNRVLKEWKEKDPVHVEWTRAWIQTLTDLQKYIKQWHTTGLVWSGKGSLGGTVPPPPPGCPPPPPPPLMDIGSLDLNAGVDDDRSALFAEINRGADVTKGLKKVTSDMQTHKNPTLRTGPAPFKTPSAGGGVHKQVDKPPVFNRDGKKWLIEYQKSNPGLLIDNAEMNNVIYMFRCENSTLTVKGKVNSVVMDSCKKCSLLIDSVVASIEFVNCQSVQMQVLQKCPTISIDKTDGCQMYLSKDSLGVEIVSSKSSEMNVLIPKDNGDYVEQPIPEQFKTTIKGTTLQTICIESLG